MPEIIEDTEMKKIIILAILCVMNAISLQALNTARLTLIYDDNMKEIEGRVDIDYYNFLLNQRSIVDTFHLKGSQAEQIVDFEFAIAICTLAIN